MMNFDARWAGQMTGVGDDVARPRLRAVGRVGLIELRGAVVRSSWHRLAAELDKAHERDRVEVVVLSIASRSQAVAGFSAAVAALQRLEQKKMVLAHFEGSSGGLAVILAGHCRTVASRPAARIGWLQVGYLTGVSPSLPSAERVDAAVIDLRDWRAIPADSAIQLMRQGAANGEQLEGRFVDLLCVDTFAAIRLFNRREKSSS